MVDQSSFIFFVAKTSTRWAALPQRRLRFKKRFRNSNSFVNQVLSKCSAGTVITKMILKKYLTQDFCDDDDNACHEILIDGHDQLFFVLKRFAILILFSVFFALFFLPFSAYVFSPSFSAFSFAFLHPWKSNEAHHWTLHLSYHLAQNCRWPKKLLEHFFTNTVFKILPNPHH